MERTSKIRITTFGNPLGEASQPAGVSISTGIQKTSIPAQSTIHCTHDFWLVSVLDVNRAFADEFRRYANDTTRLLVIFKDGDSLDYMTARLFELQIRIPQRFYVLDARTYGKVVDGMKHAQALVKRLELTMNGGNPAEQILDARIDHSYLRVVNLDLIRLNVPLQEIPELNDASRTLLEQVEVYEDGSQLYWSELDTWLGWNQLQQITDPSSARKSWVNNTDFNLRHGRAIQAFRESKGITPTGIPGLSPKQLQRIEKGECRLTTHAIVALTKVHGMSAPDYLSKLAAMVESARAEEKRVPNAPSAPPTRP